MTAVPTGGNPATGAKIHVLDDGQRIIFDYYQPAGSTLNQIRYFGIAPEGTPTSQSSWVIKRMTWSHLSDNADHVTDLQTITGVWDNRASLAWSP